MMFNQSIIENFFFFANLSNILPLAIFLFYFSLTRKVGYAKAVAISCAYVLLFVAYYKLFPERIDAYFDAANFLGEYLAFSGIIYFSFNTSLFRKIVVFAGIAFLLFFIIYLTGFVITELDPVINSVKSIILIILSLLVFYERFQKETEQFIYADYRFWGLIGLIIYISGSFLFNLAYSEYFVEVKDLEIIIPSLFLVKSIFLAISLILLIKQTKKSPGRKEKDIPFLDLE